MSAPTAEQIARLPQWAQDHIAKIERERFCAVRSRNEFRDRAALLEKCAVRTEVRIRRDGEQWQVFGSNSRRPVESKTLTLAISKFDLALFEK